MYSNIGENGWKNVTVHEVAVGNRSAPIGLREGINSGVVAAGDGAYQCMVRPLDELVTDRCDLLKIDVEGYEWLVLQGAQKLIERDRPTLLLEYHPNMIGRYGGSLDDVLPFLKTYYGKLRFFDVPTAPSLMTKFRTRYLSADPVREINITGIPESQLHEGRFNIWILAE